MAAVKNQPGWIAWGFDLVQRRGVVLPTVVLTIVGAVGSTAIAELIFLFTEDPPPLVYRLLPVLIPLVLSPWLYLPALLILRKMGDVQELLRETENSNQTLLDSVPGAVTYVDVHGRYQFINKTFEDWFGLSRENIVGRPVKDILGEDSYRGIAERFAEALKGQGSTFEVTRKFAARGSMQGQLTFAPDIGPDGEVRGFYSLLTDVSESHLAQQRLQDFAETASDWFWETDAAGIYTYFSGRLEEKTGIPREDILGKNREQFLNSYASDDRDTNPEWRRIAELVEKNQPYDGFRYAVVNKAGKSLVIEVSAIPIFGGEGEFLGYRGVGRDVTKDEESRRLLKDAIESFSSGFALFDQDDRLVLFNSHYQNIIDGYAPGRLRLGMTFKEIIDHSVGGGPFMVPEEERAEFVAERLRQHLDAPNQREHQLSSGQWVLASEYRTSDGGIALILTDISERIQVEKALAESQNDYRNVMEGSIQGVLITTVDRKALFANDELATMFGYDSAEEIMALENILPLLAPHEMERLNKLREPFLNSDTQETLAYEFEGVRKDGSRIWLELRGGAIVWRGKKAAHIALVDITDRRMAEEERRLALIEAKSANRAKSEFLTNMSHELRTPLNAVIGFSEALAMGIRGEISEAQAEYAHDISVAGRHLLDIINDILDLSKVESGKFEPYFEHLDVEGMIYASLRLISARAEEAQIRTKTDLPDRIPPLYADGRVCKQMLINLLSNSVKFTPAGGKVVVKVTLPETGGLHIEVRDTGSGIRPEDMPKALSPFGQIDGSLGRQHEGTGLGLPLVVSFMEMHGGKLELESAPGGGTIARLVFPPNKTG